MPKDYEEARDALYQAAQGDFVAERKRLAAELKAGGDAGGAARLAKLVRPPISAWAVNQLWWHEQETFEALFGTAERLRRGDRAATDAHREASANLRAAAAKILADAGHGTSDATLRRISATLAALAASGGFEPEAPGTLGTDRDPPGFEAWGIGNGLPALPTKDEPPAKAATPEREEKGASKREAEAERERKRKAEAEAEAEREREAEAERRRQAQLEAERKRAERHRLDTALSNARKDRTAHARDAERLERELAAAKAALSRVDAAIEKLESELRELEPS